MIIEAGKDPERNKGPSPRGTGLDGIRLADTCYCGLGPHYLSILEMLMNKTGMVTISLSLFINKHPVAHKHGAIL